MKSNTSILVLFLILGTLLGTSCVSNKKVTYLQYEEEVSYNGKVVTDSIVRVYQAGQLRYKLQPNDVVDIKIASPTPEEYNPFFIADKYITASGVASGNLGGGANSQNVGYRIDPLGFLNLPIIGQLYAEGLTIDQLEDTVTTLAAVELEDPVIKINLLNFRFSVLGEVNNEGVQFSSDNSLTMMQAIAMAGGADEFGDLSQIKVIRKLNEENYVFYVNLLNESFLSSEFYFIHPHDVILVSPLKSRSYLKYVSPNLSIIASTISLVVSIIALVTLNSAR